MGRTPPPLGNSACRGGHSPYKTCYTGSCRSRSGKRPFQTPFLAPAHKSPNSGGPLRGGLVRPFPFRTFPFCILQLLPDGGLFLRRGSARLAPGLLQFPPTVTIVDNPVPIDERCIRILAFRGLSACQGSLNSSKIVVNEAV